MEDASLAPPFSLEGVNGRLPTGKGERLIGRLVVAEKRSHESLIFLLARIRENERGRGSTRRVVKPPAADR